MFSRIFPGYSHRGFWPKSPDYTASAIRQDTFVLNHLPSNPFVSNPHSRFSATIPIASNLHFGLNPIDENRIRINPQENTAVILMGQNAFNLIIANPKGEIIDWKSSSVE